MARPRLPWIRMWVECLDHPKVSLLPDSVFRTWVTVLLRASQQTSRWRFASVAHAAAVTSRPRRDVTVLIGAGLLDLDTDGGVAVHDPGHWQRRGDDDLYGDEGSGDLVEAPGNRTSNVRQSAGNRTDFVRETYGNRTANVLARARAREEGEGEGEEEKEPHAQAREVRPAAPGAMAGAQAHPRHGAREAVTAIVASAPRARDALWDALADLFGIPALAGERSLRNRVVAEYRLGCRESGIDEADMAGDIRRAAANWPNVMGSATLTPTALAKHHSTLLVGPQIRGREDGVVVRQRVTEAATVHRRSSTADLIAAALSSGDGDVLDLQFAPSRERRS